MTVNGISVDEWVYRNPNRSTTESSIMQEMEETRRWANINQDVWNNMVGDPIYANPEKSIWSKAHIITMRRRELQGRSIQSDLEYRANKAASEKSNRSRGRKGRY